MTTSTPRDIDTMPLVTFSEVLDLIEHPDTDVTVIAAACLLAAHKRGTDVGEAIANAGSLAAGTLRDVDVLLANRPGSWEADLAGQLITNTVGHNPGALDTWHDARLDRWRPLRRFHGGYRDDGTTDDPIPADVTHLREAWAHDKPNSFLPSDTYALWVRTPDGWVSEGVTDEDENGNFVEHRPLDDTGLYAECVELVEDRAAAATVGQVATA